MAAKTNSKPFTLAEAKVIGDKLGIDWTVIEPKQFCLGLNAERAASECAHRRSGFVRFRARPVVDQCDIDTGHGERRRNDSANALAPGNQGHPIPDP